MAFTIILSYFEIEDAISFQALNKHMYYVKTPLMTDVILGRRIDPEIILYSEYKNKKGAISVIVGRVDPNVPNTELIEDFLKNNTMLSTKYEYSGVCWQCCEMKALLIAAFEFKHERKVKLDHSNRFYFKNKNEREKALERFTRLQK